MEQGIYKAPRNWPDTTKTKLFFVDIECQSWCALALEASVVKLQEGQTQIVIDNLVKPLWS